MSIAKYKWLLAVFLIGILALFTLTNYDAYYNIKEYWLFILIELGGFTLAILMFFIIFRLDSILTDAGYIAKEDIKGMQLHCETMKQSLNKALDKNYLSTITSHPNESPATNRERMKAKKINY